MMPTGFNNVTGRVFLEALMVAGITQLWALGIGGKMRWKDFAETFEGSLEPRHEVTLDLGRTILRPDSSSFTLYQAGAPAAFRTEEHGTVHSRTYGLFGRQQYGTLHYAMSVRSLAC
jgi:hypothetical protein